MIEGRDVGPLRGIWEGMPIPGLSDTRHTPFLTGPRPASSLCLAAISLRPNLGPLGISTGALWPQGPHQAPGAALLAFLACSWSWERPNPQALSLSSGSLLDLGFLLRQHEVSVSCFQKKLLTFLMPFVLI